MDSNINNNNTRRSNKTSAVAELLFSDSKPLTTTLGKKPSSTGGDDAKLEEAIKPLENRIKSLQATVKDLQGDIKLIVESLTIIKGQLSKAVAETILPLEDWVKLRTTLKELWPTQKGFSEETLKEIIEEKLGIDTDNLENNGVVKIALDKMKNYLRGTLFKTFDSLVTAAINNFYQNNATVGAEDIDSHCKRILDLRKWSKSNATESDIALAKDLIMEELKARVRALSEVDSDADESEPLFKKRRLEKNSMIHPGAKMNLPTTRPVATENKEDH